MQENKQTSYFVTHYSKATKVCSCCLGTGLADLKVFPVTVLGLKYGLGHLEIDVAALVGLVVGDDKDGDSAGRVDGQPHRDHHVGHQLLLVLTELDVAVNDANHQTCSKTNSKI